MASYRLTTDARADIVRIYRRGLRDFGERQADTYFGNLHDHFAKIAEHPLLFPHVPDINEPYRRCVCGVDCIYYEITDDEVRIVRILGRQDHTLIF